MVDGRFFGVLLIFFAGFDLGKSLVMLPATIIGMQAACLQTGNPIVCALQSGPLAMLFISVVGPLITLYIGYTILDKIGGH